MCWCQPQTMKQTVSDEESKRVDLNLNRQRHFSSWIPCLKVDSWQTCDSLVHYSTGYQGVHHTGDVQQVQKQTSCLELKRLPEADRSFSSNDDRVIASQRRAKICC